MGDRNAQHGVDDRLPALANRALGTDNLARLRDSTAATARPGECLALVGRAASIPPCPTALAPACIVAALA
jgi:hypothetical protein